MRQVIEMRPRLMIVDDDEDQQSMLEEYLSPHFETLSVGTGDECLMRVNEFSPAIVLLDISLPGLSGLEACRGLKSISSTKVVFMTGRADVESKVGGFDAGADDYMVKPFSKDELYLKTGLFTTLWRLEQEIQVHDQSSQKIVESIRRQLLKIKEMNIGGDFDDELAAFYRDVNDAANAFFVRCKQKCS